MEPLTEKQLRLLKFIEACLDSNKPPSQYELAQHLHLSRNAIRQLLDYLQKKGYLADSGGHRGLRLSRQYLESKKATEGIPVVGRVAAGEPIFAEQNIGEYIDLNELLGRKEGCFLLRVTGDSMVDEGIMDGDYVVVKPASAIENGQIGVVLLDDEATVKRIFIQKDHVVLKPANKAAGYKTKYIKRDSKTIRIIGKVIEQEVSLQELRIKTLEENSMENIIERLKLEKEEHDKIYKDAGYKDGLEDAKTMEYSEFVEVLKPNVNICKTSVWENWMEDQIKECENEDSAFDREAYLAGWLDSVKEFWAEIKDSL